MMVVDSPEQVAEDPYGEGWLLKVRVNDPSEVMMPCLRMSIPGRRGINKQDWA